MPDQPSPRDAILDVLASARVKSPFALAEIADRHALAIAGADWQPDPAPTRIGGAFLVRCAAPRNASDLEREGNSGRRTRDQIGGACVISMMISFR